MKFKNAKSSRDDRIIELLNLHTQEFQLKSGTEKLRSSEQFLSRKAKHTEDYERTSHASTMPVLEYLFELVTRDMVSLETGGGWSTCVFAACSGTHIFINPDITSNKMIQDFLCEQFVGSGDLIILSKTSDTALPNLDTSIQIDIALIDGNHSFPVPIIDWHYIDFHLKRKGILLIDDAHMNSVGVLCEYLISEESYGKVTNIGNTVVFRKNKDTRVWGWKDQIFNREKTQAIQSLHALDKIKFALRGIIQKLTAYKGCDQN